MSEFEIDLGAPEPPEPTPNAEPVEAELRRFPGRKNSRKTTGHRRIKMVRPVCDAAKMSALGLPEGDACQDQAKAEPGWWLRCEHNPYFSLTRRVEQVPTFGAPNERGERTITGYDNREVFVEAPNLTQVSLTPRHNNGGGPGEAQAFKGYKFPQEVGLAPYCQFMDCWSHDIKFTTRVGDFCEAWQAQLVAADVQGTVLEAGAANLPGSIEKRRKQLHDALPL